VVASLLLIAFTTVALLYLDLSLHSEHLILGYLAPTTFIALRYGSGPALFACMASVLCAAFFLYPPKFTIYMAAPLHMVESAFFCLLAITAGRIVAKLGDDTPG
jgi:two-component system sensor histidine kinase KdpD